MRILPPAPFGAALLRRAALLWLLGRLCIAMFGAGTGEVEDVIHLGMPTSVALVGIVTLLSHLDARRRHELILLANLCVTRTRFLLTAALPPALLEAAVRLVP